MLYHCSGSGIFCLSLLFHYSEQAYTSIIIKDAEFDLTAVSRGIKCNGSITLISGTGIIKATDDAIKAEAAFTMASGH